MRIDIMTLFPETVNAVLHESIIGRAAAKGFVEINCVQIRDYTDNKQMQVDDYPYGGGWGCVLMAQPLKACLDDIMSTASGKKSRVIYLSPQGERYTQETAKRLQNNYDHLVLVCGHYEGIDERFIEKCVDEEISIGDFVMTGGEIGAMAIADSVCRLVPGVLSNEECYIGESHWNGLLEYPQYTRPEVWEGMKVPEILLNGDHDRIEEWRYNQQLIRTKKKRPDMFEKLDLSDSVKRKLQKAEMITEPVTYRKATLSDLEKIYMIRDDAREILGKRHIDQWQGDYPDNKIFEDDINKDSGYVILHGDEICAYFAFSDEKVHEYDAITDGKWSPNSENYAAIHRGCVKAEYRGTGIADMMLEFADEIASNSGIKFIRVDTHRKNKSMLKLLKNNQYRYRGNVLLECEPGRDPARQAYEKVVKK